MVRPECTQHLLGFRWNKPGLCSLQETLSIGLIHAGEASLAQIATRKDQLFMEALTIATQQHQPRSASYQAIRAPATLEHGTAALPSR